MTDDLKLVRCGCGGEASIYTYEARWKKTEDGYQRSVGCLKCGISTQLYDTEAEAVQAWNRAMGSTEKSSTVERTAKVIEDEWTEHKMMSRDYGKIYYQHDCCCDLYESPYQFCPYCGKKMKRKNHE